MLGARAVFSTARAPLAFMSRAGPWRGVVNDSQPGSAPSILAGEYHQKRLKSRVSRCFSSVRPIRGCASARPPDTLTSASTRCRRMRFAAVAIGQIFLELSVPIYVYRCSACGHAQDVLQKMSDPVLTVCPECGESTYQKQVTAAGFQLKGSGWYVTDFRDKAGKGAAPASASPASSSAASGGSSSTPASGAAASPASGATSAPTT